MSRRSSPRSRASRPRASAATIARRLQNLERDLKTHGLRPGRGDRRACRRRSSSRARACASRRSRSAATSSPARPASARPRSPSQLARSLGIELIRFDMSEYMERHTVSRLIGAPPGYVGFDQGGLLTDAIDQHPHAVLLLDEIEKAHPDLFNILLQVMDHGKLTDHNGKTVDFRNVILIMTTNAGASEMSKPAIGFGRERPDGEDRRPSSACSRPSSATGSMRSSPSARLPPEVVGQGRRQVRDAAGGAARRPAGHHRAQRRGPRLAGPQGLRPALWRPAARPGDPGVHQEAAGRRAAVRHAWRRAASCGSMWWRKSWSSPIPSRPRRPRHPSCRRWWRPEPRGSEPGAPPVSFRRRRKASPPGEAFFIPLRDSAPLPFPWLWLPPAPGPRIGRASTRPARRAPARPPGSPAPGNRRRRRRSADRR